MDELGINGSMFVLTFFPWIAAEHLALLLPSRQPVNLQRNYAVMFRAHEINTCDFLCF